MAEQTSSKPRESLEIIEEENTSNSKLTVALEEFRMIQTIIINHEALFDKIRGWCITLISAISVAYISDDISISAAPYIILSWFIIFFFAFTEAVHRVAHGRAMNRSEDVENQLSNNCLNYDGPKIRKSLKTGVTLPDLKEFSNKLRFWVIWGTLFLIVIVVSWF